MGHRTLWETEETQSEEPDGAGVQKSRMISVASEATDTAR